MKQPFMDFTKSIQQLKPELSQAIENVLVSRNFILGKEVNRFEKQFSTYCGARFAVGVGSGTDAIHLALRALQIGHGDEVVTSPLTFAATAFAILQAGSKPVFVDVEPETGCIDPSQLEKLKSKKIKAIVPVHLYGLPVDMKPLLKSAKRKGCHVIEDACQAHGAEYQGKKAGTFGKAGCFSFYPTKNLGAYGDGGAVVTSNKRVYSQLLRLRNYGCVKKNVHEVFGINSRLDEFQAALLRVKLKKLSVWNKKRRQLAEVYKNALSGLPLGLPIDTPQRKHVYHLFVIRCKKRNALKTFLQSKGVETLIHYPTPLHLQKAFWHLGYSKGNFPVAERLCNEILSLPFYPEMSAKEVQAVANHIRAFFKST